MLSPGHQLRAILLFCPRSFDEAVCAATDAVLRLVKREEAAITMDNESRDTKCGGLVFPAECSRKRTSEEKGNTTGEDFQFNSQFA